MEKLLSNNIEREKIFKLVRTRKDMKKRFIFLFLLGLIFMSLYQISAEIQYWQTRSDEGNGTIKNHMYFSYVKEGFGMTDDFLKGSNPEDIYLYYNQYVSSWNSKNPFYQVDYCNFKVNSWTRLQPNATIILNVNYTSSSPDISNGKYFIRLNDGDGFTADQTCYFSNKTYNQLYIPIDMQTVTPTWQCKACQYYEYSVLEKDIVKAQSIGDFVVQTSDYIKKLVLLNFEIILMLFWVFLILMIFVAIGLIFFGAYWVFIYLKHLAK